MTIEETWTYGNVVQAEVQTLLAGACQVLSTSKTAGAGRYTRSGQGEVGNTGLIQECAGT